LFVHLADLLVIQASIIGHLSPNPLEYQRSSTAFYIQPQALRKSSCALRAVISPANIAPLAASVVTRTFVPIREMAPILPRTVIVAEDARFCSHSGVDWQELNKVLDRNAGPNRGASTVTMQVVKNLFLWKSRSYVRKALEIPLALYADLVWSKRRTMEIYLNIVELGPGIFGAEAAAQHYFKRHAKELSPGQAALLVSVLPNPIERNPGKPSRFVNSRARTIAGRGRAAGAYINCLAR
jgi:monofunctional biosynthetic peptidoglycan transglycosylase